MAFPWTMSTCRDGIGSGGDRRVKRLLQKEKEVSSKYVLIAAKEKTTWNIREPSEERRGEKNNGTNLQRVPAKNNCHKRKVEKTIVVRHSHIPTTTNSQEHSTITRVVHGGIELVLI
jgi:hypothetical protein